MRFRAFKQHIHIVNGLYSCNKGIILQDIKPATCWLISLGI